MPPTTSTTLTATPKKLCRRVVGEAWTLVVSTCWFRILPMADWLIMFPTFAAAAGSCWESSVIWPAIA